jgi:methionyl-tRNA formyltransferase
MQMEAGLDTGPVRLCDRTPIGGKTAGELTAELSAMGARLMVEVLGDLAAHPPAAQPEDGVTYAAKIDKAEARLDFSQPAEQVERQVRAFNPPGAWFEANGERVRVLESAMADGRGAPGTVIDGELTIACGSGAIQPVIVQRAGRGIMSADELLRGFAIPVGARL